MLLMINDLICMHTLIWGIAKCNTNISKLGFHVILIELLPFFVASIITSKLGFQPKSHQLRINFCKDTFTENNKNNTCWLFLFYFNFGKTQLSWLTSVLQKSKKLGDFCAIKVQKSWLTFVLQIQKVAGHQNFNPLVNDNNNIQNQN